MPLITFAATKLRKSLGESLPKVLKGSDTKRAMIFGTRDEPGTTKKFLRRGWEPTPARSAPIASTSRRTGLPLTNLPYFVRRTASNQLPVYTDTKAGGTLQQTKIQKIEGNVEALKDQLAWLEKTSNYKIPARKGILRRDRKLE
ncbi:hypothetical protein KEM54_004583 [Ascosphaera aggregata]|nr:hypothetical protein KEM54_004583 [Ascosphaera aggregata]